MNLFLHTSLDICYLRWCFQRYSVFIVDSRQIYKFYTCNMATTLSKPPRSRWSNFVHDLVTVDFDHADIYTGVRIATLLAPLLILGLITNHVSSLVILGAVYVLGIDEIQPVGQRTRTLLSVSYFMHQFSP